MNSATNIEVELDVFSGRPNPRFLLGDELRETLRRVRDQPPEPAERRPPPLGYRGFVIANLTGDRTIPRQMRVYAAVVTVIEEGPAQRYREPAGLEESLLNRARQLGYGEVIDRFRGEGPKPQAATGAS